MDIAKLKTLESHLVALGPFAIACSGGVDSSFLAAVAARCASDRTLLVHARTPLVPDSERLALERLRTLTGLPAIEVEVNVFSVPELAANDPRRCYHCKLAVFSSIMQAARAHGFPTVMDGSNADDRDDYRPGMQAVAELGVRSPLLELDWTKAEERAWLRAWELPMAHQASSACLASRIPYGEPVTRENVALAARCEDALRDLGFHVVRVRLSRKRASIEVGRDELARLVDMEETATRLLLDLGCASVSIDPRGYRQGSLNDALGY